MKSLKIFILGLAILKMGIEFGLAFVRVLPQPVEQAHAEAGGTFGDRRRICLCPYSRDVYMRPGRVANMAL